MKLYLALKLLVVSCLVVDVVEESPIERILTHELRFLREYLHFFNLVLLLVHRLFQVVLLLACVEWISCLLLVLAYPIQVQS